MPDDKKGITVRIDAQLHAEISRYAQENGMTMTEFVVKALDDELHPKFNMKEGKNMENVRTIAFQVPEELYQRIKDYLQRTGMTQKQFFTGLIETELDREQSAREAMDRQLEEDSLEGELTEADSAEEAVNDADSAEEAVTEAEDSGEDGSDDGGEEEDEDEDEDEGEDFSISM